MKRLLIFSAATAFILNLALAAAAQAPAPKTFRFIFNKGDVYNYSIKMESTGQMKMTGLGSVMGGGRESFDMPIDSSSYMEMEMKVQDVDAAGVATLTVKFTRMKVKAGTNVVVDTDANNDKELPAFAKALINNSYSLKISPSGKITDIVFPGDENMRSAGMWEVNLKDMMGQNFVSFPEKALLPGDTWSYDSTVELPWSQGKKITIAFDLNLLGYETFKQLECGAFEIKYKDDLTKQINKLSFPAPGTGKNVDMNLSKLEQDLTGKIYFAPAQGLFAGSHVEMDQLMTGSMDMGTEDGSTIGYSMDMTISIDIELL